MHPHTLPFCTPYLLPVHVRASLTHSLITAPISTTITLPWLTVFSATCLSVCVCLCLCVSLCLYVFIHDIYTRLSPGQAWKGEFVVRHNERYWEPPLFDRDGPQPLPKLVTQRDDADDRWVCGGVGVRGGGSRGAMPAERLVSCVCCWHQPCGLMPLLIVLLLWLVGCWCCCLLLSPTNREDIDEDHIVEGVVSSRLGGGARVPSNDM